MYKLLVSPHQGHNNNALFQVFTNENSQVKKPYAYSFTVLSIINYAINKKMLAWPKEKRINTDSK